MWNPVEVLNYNYGARLAPVSYITIIIIIQNNEARIRKHSQEKVTGSVVLKLTHPPLPQYIHVQYNMVYHNVHFFALSLLSTERCNSHYFQRDASSESNCNRNF